MSDITLEDLVQENDTGDSGGSGNQSQDSGGGGSGGEWVEKLFERLDEKGLIDAIIAEKAGMDPAAAVNAPEPQTTDTSGGGGAEVDAETVAQFGKVVIDQFGDVPISQVVKAAESNPEQVNTAIQQALHD